MKKTILVLSVAGAATIAIAAWAEPRVGSGRFQGGGPGGSPGGMDRGQIIDRVLANPEIAKQAGITEEQIKKIKDAQFNFQKQGITMRADAEQAKLEVRHLMQADKVDRDAVSKAIDAAAAKEVAFRKAEIMHMLDVKEALGPDAQKKIREIVQKHMAERMKNIQQQQPGGPGGQDIQRPMMQRLQQLRGRMQGQGQQGPGPVGPPPASAPQGPPQ
jgi:Spy/CpxP family protein refolding chaperone